MAEALHVLPRSGGLFDQDAGDVFRMEAVLLAKAQPETTSNNRANAEARLKKRLDG